MESNYRLYCLILEEVIKYALQPKFDHLSPNELKLWDVMLPLKLEEGYNSELRRTLDDLGHHLMLERQKFLLPELEMQEVTVLGHLMSSCGQFRLVIALGQNEIAGDSDEPLEGGGGRNRSKPVMRNHLRTPEALLHHRKFLEDSQKSMHLDFVFPCFHTLVFGPCVGIVCRPTGHSALYWHETDIRAQALAAHTFRSLKIAIKELEKLYREAIPSLEPGGESTLECPY